MPGDNNNTTCQYFKYLAEFAETSNTDMERVLRLNDKYSAHYRSCPGCKAHADELAERIKKNKRVS